MTSHHRRTPCIGICSTTYGDLVCRGCKRFAHEIVQWNGYAIEQQQTVWTRLFQLRISAVDRYLSIVDEPLLFAAQKKYAIEQTPWQLIAWELLHLRGERLLPAAIGLALVDVGVVGDFSNRLADTLDKDLYTASLAYYERSFRILAQ